MRSRGKKNPLDLYGVFVENLIMYRETSIIFSVVSTTQPKKIFDKSRYLWLWIEYPIGMFP